MTKREEQAEWKALTGVRGAVKGWAFTSRDKLPGYIARAEEARDSLPENYRAVADALIQPLRDAAK